MNIANLNSQELEQLQTLLNKMNPIQVQVTEQDPVEKMIQSIIENFDWEETHSVMEFMGWKWSGQGVPTIEDMMISAERLLRNSAESRLTEYKDEHWEQGIISATGGFEAQAWCNKTKTDIIALDLKFVLNSWDESIEDEQE